MSSSDNNNGPLSLDNQIDEDRVRRALGLKTSGAPHQQRPEQARQRHKFIADGAVPVVMLNRSDSETVGIRERLTAVEASLENERAAHNATKRVLHELQATHHILQTRMQHNEMAHADALAAEREARRLAEEAAASLRLQLAERLPRVDAPLHEEPAALPTPARRGRKPRLPGALAATEPKPVRWWTPTYRAKQR